jgi:hypothetical protein
MLEDPLHFAASQCAIFTGSAIGQRESFHGRDRTKMFHVKHFCPIASLFRTRNLPYRSETPSGECPTGRWPFQRVMPRADFRGMADAN